jgi:hypothetical protein
MENVPVTKSVTENRENGQPGGFLPDSGVGNRFAFHRRGISVLDFFWKRAPWRAVFFQHPRLGLEDVFLHGLRQVCRFFRERRAGGR